MGKVADLLGMAIANTEPMVAVVRCNGTCEHRPRIAEVDEEKCTSCGSCVKACPRGIIELRKKGPKGRRVFVSCVNKDKGPVAMKACAVSCIGCGKCEKECNFGAITVENNLAYIDHTQCRLCRKCVTVCPKHAIVDVNFPTPAPAPKPKEPAAPKPETDSTNSTK